jgi:hypothetical protein
MQKIDKLNKLNQIKYFIGKEIIMLRRILIVKAIIKKKIKLVTNKLWSNQKVFKNRRNKAKIYFNIASKHTKRCSCLIGI